MGNTDLTHEERVRDFMQKCREERPEDYEHVCKKYPVQSRLRKLVVYRREQTVGLLGLAPSRISLAVAEKNDMEPIFSGSEQE